MIRSGRWYHLLTAVAASAACAHAPRAASPAGAAPGVGNAQVPVSARVVPGADRLFGEYADLIRGKRVALLANHSARLADGTHLADALHQWPQAKLQVLLGMEYDIRSNDYSLPADPDSVVDAPTGVIKYDLYYGRTHKPTPEMLRGVDVVVVDLQDVGARFYEHINVLGLTMEAAAENGIDIVVLDRPNPLGALGPDGFVADSSDWYSFGSFGPLPVVHGLTIGEVARFYEGERLLRGGVSPRLHVVPMKGWKRSMGLARTGLPWRKPSPNLLTLESVLAYAGTCLFEATNLSEGRGSDAPFQLVGAPWLDAPRATSLLNRLGLRGVLFEATSFTPERQPFLSRPPRFSGQKLPSIRVRISDRDRYEPAKVGVAMLWAVHHLHPDSLTFKEDVLERLAATPRLKRMILDGKTPREIFAAWEPEVRAFERRSAKYRLYR